MSNPYGSGSAPTPDGPPRVAPPARGQRLARLYVVAATLSSVLLVTLLALLVWLD